MPLIPYAKRDKHDGNSILSTILFSKKYFTESTSSHWLKKHGYKNNGVDIKPNTYRYRQHSPSKNGKYYSKKITTGVIFVFYE